MRAARARTSVEKRFPGLPFSIAYLPSFRLSGKPGLVHFSSVLSSEHRAKSVPPVPNRFVADVDATLVQQILNISQRQWKANVHHDHQANDLRAALKGLERVFFHHASRLQNHPARLNQLPSDIAAA